MTGFKFVCKRALELSLWVVFGLSAWAQTTPPMTFFITSVGLGDGGNLGGLAGADAHCQKLATAVGAGNKTWRAYLSTQGAQPVHARDRIGTGPWHNAKGELVAADVVQLHEANHINEALALTEQGQGVPSSTHDMLTGSDLQGRALDASEGDRTCQNWASNASGSAMVGHHNLRRNVGGGASPWNAAHTTNGCSRQAFWKTSGDGLFYCFAQVPSSAAAMPDNSLAAQLIKGSPWRFITAYEKTLHEFRLGPDGRLQHRYPRSNGEWLAEPVSEQQSFTYRTISGHTINFYLGQDGRATATHSKHSSQFVSEATQGR